MARSCCMEKKWCPARGWAGAPRLGPIGEGVRWDLGKSAELVDEVTSIVEYPVVLAGSFDKMFLAVPKGCLVISMQQHQKDFPLADARGELLPNFLFVSNMQAANPKDIIRGDGRGLRARL